MSNMIEQKKEEITKNYKKFKEILPSIIKEHKGEYALMRHESIVGFYKDLSELTAKAKEIAQDDIYSVQRVEEQILDLGFYSCLNFTRK